MAVAITPQFGSSSCPQLRLTVTEQSATNVASTLKWVLEYVGHGYAASVSGARSYSASIHGTTVASGTYNINGVTGVVTIKSGTITINKTPAVQPIGFSCTMAFNLTWSGTYGGTKTGSGAINVAAKPSYTIKYSTNGGSNCPPNQTKFAGDVIKITTSQPTRSGYTFLGWATSETGSVVYASGANYSADASVTLYAVWGRGTYTVSYNANGGSGAPSSQTKQHGVNLTLSSTRPTRSEYNFVGWGLSASSTTSAYQPGGTYSADSSITLYALWQSAYTKPRISNLYADRCNSSGTLTDSGTYAKVLFNWTTDKTISELRIDCYDMSGNMLSRTYASGGGTSGTVEKVIGGSLATEYAYDIRIQVYDGTGATAASVVLPPIQYIIDFLAGGKGVAFGKPASEPNIVETDWKFVAQKDVQINGNTVIDNNLEVYGDTALQGSLKTYGSNTFNGLTWLKNDIYDKYDTLILNGKAMYTSEGIDPNTTTHDLILTHHSNGPVPGHYYYIRTIYFGTKGSRVNKAQYALPYSETGSMYHRYCFDVANDSQSWSSWRRHVNSDELTSYVKANTTPNLTSIELFATNPYIDFHRGNNSSVDFTARIINNTGANLEIHNTISQTSDRRYKKDIVEMDDAFVDALREIPPVVYRFRDDPDGCLLAGFIAQDILAVLKKCGIEDLSVVRKDFQNFYSLDYNQMEAFLLKGWQHHDKEIAALKTENENLNKKVETLEDEVALLKQELAALKESINK